MIKETSTDAYDSIQDTIPEKQSAVYSIFKNEPDRDFTNEQVKEILGWEINRITPRVKELTDAGLIVVVGKREGKSGRLAETRQIVKHAEPLR